MPQEISRSDYAAMFGPTTGDRVRLADTDLFIEVEDDRTIYGEEVKFGGGKVIRDGMGQSQATREEGAVDTVITNALILDHWGVVKADIGVRDGLIAAIGKAGNPNVQPGVDIVIGPGTEVIAGEGRIVTADGVDSHSHFISPQQIDEALYSGITTMLGGGTGPAAGTNATTATLGAWHIAQMLRAADSFPVNLGGGFTFQVQQLFGKYLGWSVIPQAFAWGIVVDLHQLSKPFVRHVSQVSLSWQHTAQATYRILNSSLLPRRVRITEEGVYPQLVQLVMARELGAVVEGDCLPPLRRQSGQ